MNKSILPFLLMPAIMGMGEITRNYIPDGKPRIPKIGDIIMLNGKFHKVNRVLQTHRQVYKEGEIK